MVEGKKKGFGLFSSLFTHIIFYRELYYYAALEECFSGHNGQARKDVNRVVIKLRLGVLKKLLLSKRIHFKIF